MNNNSYIDLNTVIQRNDVKFLANKLGEEMVMMNMETGDFITMNNVGADIWTLAEQPIPVKELIQKLLSLYETTEEQCINETMQFLQTSMGEKIFIFQNEAIDRI